VNHFSTGHDPGHFDPKFRLRCSNHYSLRHARLQCRVLIDSEHHRANPPLAAPRRRNKDKQTGLLSFTVPPSLRIPKLTSSHHHRRPSFCQTVNTVHHHGARSLGRHQSPADLLSMGNSAATYDTVSLHPLMLSRARAAHSIHANMHATWRPVRRSRRRVWILLLLAQQIGLFFFELRWNGMIGSFLCSRDAAHDIYFAF
jgi:hypothetical protein